MRVVSFNPGMQITNLDQLARGGGWKYLEVLDTGEGPFIAVCWRRKRPRKLAKGRLLIEF